MKKDILDNFFYNFRDHIQIPILEKENDAERQASK